jgi:hypothetical protein
VLLRLSSTPILLEASVKKLKDSFGAPVQGSWKTTAPATMEEPLTLKQRPLAAEEIWTGVFIRDAGKVGSAPGIVAVAWAEYALSAVELTDVTT